MSDPTDTTAPEIDPAQVHRDLIELIDDGIGAAMDARFAACEQLLDEAGEPPEECRGFFLVNHHNPIQRLYGMQGPRFHAAFQVDFGFDPVGSEIVVDFGDPFVREGVLAVNQAAEEPSTSDPETSDVVE